ncbi:MAG: FAD synthetase family protein [Spirochaetaceae bacterium]|jgi:riboflavin kinase/FMN adenylyltransferase|nr:FAD synthetase family protein [Spirochaetaceae bacterium]
MQIIAWGDFVQRGLGEERKYAVTIGVFDGVHRGHRALIGKIQGKGKSLVVSFTRHPQRFLHPEREMLDIIGLDEKISIFEGLGVDALVLIDFSLDFCRMDGGAFIKTLAQNAGMAYLAIGRDFKCGYRGSLDAARIKALCETLGVECEIVQPVMDAGLPVSSSRIRAALAAGDRETAERLLGRRRRQWRFQPSV